MRLSTGLCLCPCALTCSPTHLLRGLFMAVPIAASDDFLLEAEKGAWEQNLLYFGGPQLGMQSIRALAVPAIKDLLRAAGSSAQIAVPQILHARTGSCVLRCQEEGGLFNDTVTVNIRREQGGCGGLTLCTKNASEQEQIHFLSMQNVWGKGATRLVGNRVVQLVFSALPFG